MTNKRKTVKEVIENFDYLCKRVHYTEDLQYRYILAEPFIKQVFKILENEEDSYNSYDLSIENFAIVEEISKKLKSNPSANTFTNPTSAPLNEMSSNKMTLPFCLVTKEIMETLLEGLEVDYIVKVPFKSPKCYLRDGVVFTQEQFLSLKEKTKKKNFDAQNNLEKAVIPFKELKLVFTAEEHANPREDIEEYTNIEKTSKMNQDNIISLKTDENGINKITTTSKRKKEFIGLKKKIPKNSEKTPKSRLTTNNSSSISQLKLPETNLNEYSTPSTPINESKMNSDKSTNINKSYSSLISKLEGFKFTELKPKGLYNPSVYCFMNTCLQCLASIPELNFYFASSLYAKEKKSKKDPVASTALKEFISSYDSSSGSFKAPTSLYKVCHSFLPANTQHDCQEFLRRFLSKVQEELNYDKKYTVPDKAGLETAWNIYRGVNPSFVDSLFTGLMRSSVICNLCDYKSDTYDPFMDLSVPIKKKPVENLESCLDYYFTKEHIDCEYKCSSCKKKTSVRMLYISIRFGRNSKL